MILPAFLLPLASLVMSPLVTSPNSTDAPYKFVPPATGLWPVDRPSLSYWLQGVRADPLLDYRTEGSLPQEAEVVVIGSGMTGALVVYELLHSDKPPLTVVLLEARETCSGATGRNAGHCKPDQYKGFTKYAQKFGEQMALDILRNEQETFDAAVAFIEKEKIDCDLWTGQTLDVAMSVEVKEGQLATFEAYKRAGGPTDHITVITDPKEASKVSRLKSAQALISWRAGSLYPWKVVAHLIRESLKKGLNFQTYTRVESITPAGKQGEWSVNTPRGSIKTSKVVHATNAFAPTLLPLLKNNLISASAFMCNKVVPPPSFSGAMALQNTYGVLMPGGSMYSINPRTSSDGVVLFGGDNPRVKDLTQLFKDYPELEADDRLGGFTPVTEAVIELAENEFEGWGKFEDAPAGEGVDYDWSGVIGMTKDGVPWVGRVPGLEGHFVSAGHNGHGMARIFTASPALAKLILDPALSFDDTGLPAVFEITEERVNKLRDEPKAKRGLILGDVVKAKL